MTDRAFATLFQQDARPGTCSLRNLRTGVAGECQAKVKGENGGYGTPGFNPDGQLAAFFRTDIHFVDWFDILVCYPF